MTREDFIFTLFDNGQGLTLDQIEQAESYASDTASCMTSDNDEMPVLIEEAREVYIENMTDCEDMLELREYLKRTLRGCNEPVTDMQVYRLWLMTR